MVSFSLFRFKPGVAWAEAIVKQGLYQAPHTRKEREARTSILIAGAETAPGIDLAEPNRSRV
jgi:hypothetical protein